MGLGPQTDVRPETESAEPNRDPIRVEPRKVAAQALVQLVPMWAPQPGQARPPRAPPARAPVRRTAPGQQEPPPEVAKPAPQQAR